uniref:DnaJ domain containing protein n=2 Tax=Oryza sativa subsp. japonica TaxID=39947 RepID=Q851M1_ORYSJ|nr:hypothetical protein [Oryza sativa Japonica Group]ABF99776.1 DnaJ domain containing protein [Oryza sativa Japonica Group]
MATTHGEEAAGKAYKLAEDRFLVKDIAGALRAAREARRLFRSLPGLANAITAYEVHAPAATTRAGGRNWYAVLAVGDRSAKTSSGGGGVTHESLKRQYHRLCLVVHPDKNRSAAAAGAFRLLQKAWDELSLRHPPRAAGAAAAPGQARPSALIATHQIIRAPGLFGNSQQCNSRLVRVYLATSSSPMATGRDAEEAYELAENRFLANDIAGALRVAREAQRLIYPAALPAGLANAVAAYEVHHAASRSDGGRWYAVLAVGDPSAPTTSSGINGAVITHKSLKQQYRRLCLVLHPDKNSSAAADGAFKLLQEAWGELSLLHPPGSGATPVSWSSPPPPPAAAEAPEWKAPRQAKPRRRAMRCPHCGCSFVAVVSDAVSGVNCLDCNRWVSTSSQSGPAPPPPPQPPPPPPPPPHQRETPSPSPPPQPQFPCPGNCSRCGAKFTATVSIGTRFVPCGVCKAFSMVSVKSPSVATTWILG